MESNSDSTQECSLKIDTIWSEANESLFIKEEIVSDMEPDSAVFGQEETNSCMDHQIDTQIKDEGSCINPSDSSVLQTWQPLKKKVKSRSQRTEESKMITNHKLSCLHDTKNFKIVKRRLRCGDCRSLVCPECCKVMIPNLQSHFLGSGICSSGTYLCKLCSIIFHSLCALQAHIRIHTMDTPYVCPDCGLIYNNIYFLILHLLNKCYHVYKIVRYKCKQCPGIYFTPENFVQHIQETHIHCVFRCLYCSSLFNNYDEFNYHMENIHQKQKVQYLNYFRCSLCSNMVIPRFMYQKHVAQHRENSEFYEVDYQCLCGETYSLIGAFRSHFSYCNKKGVLPPKWSFLQRKLRTQDMVHQENFQNKEVVIQTLPVYSNDPDFKKLALVRTDNKNTIMDDCKVETGENSIKANFNGLDEAARNSNFESDRKDLCNKENEKSEQKSNASNTKYISSNTNSTSANKCKADGTQEEKNVNESLEKSISVMPGTNEGPNVHSGNSGDVAEAGEMVNGDVSEETQTYKAKELEQGDGDMSKIYDHIPRDHLGYVIKTQCPEQPKKTYEGDEIIVEKSFSPGNYKFVTELDEKTGIIRTKTVPVDELEIEEDDNINEDDYDTEGLNFSVTAKQYCNDKAKFKTNNSLSCPFCIVLFPKHNLTFQQFRLHLESYHPDAALNITVSDAGEEVPGKVGAGNSEGLDVESKTGKCEDPKEDTENISKVGSPSNSSPNQEQEINPKKRQNTPIQDPKQNSINELSVSGQKDAGGESHKRLLDDPEKEGSELGSKKLLKCIDDDVGPTEKPSADNKNESVDSWGAEECRMETVTTQEDLNGDGSECDFAAGKTKNSSATVEEVNAKETNAEEKDEDEYKKSLRECGEGVGGGRNVDETPEKPVHFDSGGKVSPKTVSDLDYEGETSKDSNWSGTSGKETKPNSPESKTEEKERSRRESEVWSEFYESLMLAEKLKKKKNSSPDSEGKKKTVVSDYSAKRVVKKPKRYRESSESADSNEYSESEEDFLLENDFVDKMYSEEKSGAEDQPNKKQMLLDKLENVDGKFVDYLFDLVTKKEKLFELYKKHSSLRANRYTHDLRSYRKKVLNGIKQRGRPLKILRYHELLKKKELSEDKNGKESYQFKKKPELSPENKTNEKKRGRPRKYYEAAKLKERRRSDKEVDFIEKNFEREENDLSPSKRKRKLSSKLQYYKKLSDEKEDFSSGQVITNKPIDLNKKFTCAVCKEVFPGLTEFRVHIVVHRMEENTYQCMECGECFVVRPSLEKHLHAFHKIKNTEKYITDNQCCSIKKEIIEVDNEPLKENQCKVCKDQFDRPIDLTKHFRIHGMAFLKEFRKEGKSSEKRNA